MLIVYEIKVVLVLFCWKHCVCQMQGNVVDGSYVNIERFPHAASLSISCRERDQSTKAFICGSSILTQKVLLTAAHCLEECTNAEIVAFVGHKDREYGSKHLAVISHMHGRYDTREMNDDVALIGLLNNLKFSDKVKRVIIMRRPPVKWMGSVAGWGLVHEENEQEFTTKLKYVVQEVLSRNACLNFLPHLPKGIICAGRFQRGTGYTAIGDSGNALMVNNYIQIGIVSYKIPKVKRSLSVFTDVGYHYNWIKRNAIRIHCTATKIAKDIRRKKMEKSKG